MSHSCLCMLRACGPVPISRALLKGSRPRSLFTCYNSHVVLGGTDLCWVQHHRFLWRIDPSCLWHVCQIATIIMGHNSSPSPSTFSKHSPVISELIICIESLGGGQQVGSLLEGGWVEIWHPWTLDNSSCDTLVTVHTQHHSQVSGTWPLPLVGPGRKWFCLWCLPGTGIF